MTEQAVTEINGYNVEEIRRFREMVDQDPGQGDAASTVVAQWLGGSRSRVEEQGTGNVVHLGGEDDLDAMQMLLASFAACNVITVAFHASLLELELEDLSVEVSGGFNLESYVGVDDDRGSGFKKIGYTVRIDAPDATQEQIDYLRERIERSSGVADTLEEEVQLDLSVEVNS